MVRRRFFPGVMTCWRCPRGIQVARTQGSRLTWVSSSASTTAPAGRPRRWRCRSARTWSQAGSPPGGDLSDAAVQGPQGDGGAAQSLPQPWDGPGAWLLEEPQDALGEGGAAQPWSAGSGPVGQCAGAVALVAVNPAAHRPRVVAEQVGDLGRRPALLGEQDHEQAAGQAVGAVQQAQQVARVGGRAGRFGVHAGGTHTSGGLVGSLWSQAPTTGEATSSAIGLTAAPGLRAELLVSRLAVGAL